MIDLTPLDDEALARIPSTLEGSFWLVGAYELPELLLEPEKYGDKNTHNYRVFNILSPNRSAHSKASIEICSAKPAISHGAGLPPLNVAYKLRYLYRDFSTDHILGTVLIKINHRILGIEENFISSCEKIIDAIYVDPSARRNGISRILLAAVLNDIPDIRVHPQFSEDGARLFGYDKNGRRAQFNKH